jgi:uncharacterized protein
MLPWRNSWFQIAFFAWIVSGALLIVDYAPKLPANSAWMQAFHRPPSQPLEAPAKPSPPSEQHSPAKESAPTRSAPGPSGETPATKAPKVSGTNAGSTELAQAKAAYDRNDYGQAFQWYRKAAAQGNGFAEEVLGQLYKDGLGVPKDQVEAAKWYQKALKDETAACNAGDMDACADVGSDYLGGEGTPPDRARGLSLLQRACDGGNLNQGCYNLGAEYANHGDLKTGLTFWTKGCSELSTNPRDDSQNVFAAAENCGQAFRAYAEGGRSIVKDAAQALEVAKNWCLAEGTHCLDIGDLYRSDTGDLTKYGISVSLDPGQAVAFYRKACAGRPANGNDAIACLDLKQMNATDKGIAHDYMQALTIDRKQCASNGSFCTDLGIMYENGLGVPTDVNKAIELYTKACNGKAPSACTALKRLGK